MSISRVGDGTPLNQKGQIITHTGTSLATLAVGTDGQILTAQSSASSGLVWANVSTGDTQYIELIAAATLTTGAHAITFSNIPNTYDDLILILNGQRYDSTVLVEATMQINSNTTTVYRYMYSDYSYAQGSGSTGNNQFIFHIDGIVPAPFEFYFARYKTSDVPKPVLMKGGFTAQSGSGNGAAGQVMHGMWNLSDAITSITLYAGYPSSTTITWDGSTPHFAILYGVKRS